MQKQDPNSDHIKAENERRVQRATEALKGYNRDGDTIQSALCDLLADLRHYCDANGLSYGDMDRRAHHHYIDELMGR